MKKLEELFDLSGKVAIVTGAAMGIGKGIAYRLSEAGADVVVMDIKLDEAEKTCGELPGNSLAIDGDVGNEEDVVATVKTAVDKFGSVDIMVNNAGIFPMKPVLEMSTEEWDRVLRINLKGAFICAREAAKQMVSQGKGGRIINIASVDALHPSMVGLAHYDASKGGMLMFTKSLALELAPHGILVNAIAPGAIETPGATGGGAISAEVIQAFTQKIPLKRMGKPDDIGTVALFLASDAASYITGSLVVADGGVLLA